MTKEKHPRHATFFIYHRLAIWISKRQNMAKGTAIGSEGMTKQKQTHAQATTTIDTGTGTETVA